MTAIEVETDLPDLDLPPIKGHAVCFVCHPIVPGATVVSLCDKVCKYPEAPKGRHEKPACPGCADVYEHRKPPSVAACNCEFGKEIREHFRLYH